MKSVVLSSLVVGAVVLVLSLSLKPTLKPNPESNPEPTPMAQFLLTDPLEEPSFEDWFCRQVEAGELVPQEGLECR